MIKRKHYSPEDIERSMQIARKMSMNLVIGLQRAAELEIGNMTKSEAREYLAKKDAKEKERGERL